MVPVPANAETGIQGPANPTPCTFPIVLLFGLFLTLFFWLLLSSVLSPVEPGPVLYTPLPCTHHTGKVSHDSKAGDNSDNGYCRQRYSETDEISTWR